MLLRWTALAMLVFMVMVASSCSSSSSSVQPNPTPIISALYPASITAGSQSFTLFIAGTGFISGSSGTSTAYWNGSPRASTVNLNTNEIAITVLASDVASSGSAAVTVSNPIPGGGVSQNAATFQIYPASPNAPQISSISPASAAPKGAAFTVTVTGANFSAGNADSLCGNMPPMPPYTGSVVSWNGSPRCTTFVSSTQLTAQILATDIVTAGCDNISVFTYGGGGNVVYSPSVSFTVASSGTPVICSISPASVVAGADAFTLSVLGAGYSSSSTVNWNGKSRTTTFVSANALQAQITSTDVAKAGTAAVTVSGSGGGGGASAPVDFVISPTPPTTPTITSVMPTSATAGGIAFTLQVTGTNFIPASVVDWNGGARATTYQSATSLQASIQATDIATAGTAEITVVSFGANGGVATSAPLDFTINPASSATARFPQVISVSAAGGPANGPSEAPAISGDGRYVAFYSQAKNLVTPQTAGNIFVRDTCVGAATCTPRTLAVDVAPDGSAPNGKTGRQVAISADGRFVGFISRATNLTAAGASASPGYWELYVRDMCAGVNVPSGCVPGTRMVSVGDDGSAANAPSASPSISGDGRYVAFVSAATNLGASAALASGPQVYVRDTCEGPTGTKSCLPSTLAVPVDAQDQLTGAQAGRPAISADGRYVAYEMWATPSAAQTAVSTSQIVLADTCLGVEVPVVCSASAERISYGTDGSVLAGANISPSVNSDGRFVAFESQPPESANANTATSSTSKAFLRDTCAGPTAPDGCTPSTILIATDASTSSAKSQSFSPAVSASGRYVSFVSGIVSNSPAGEVATEGSLLVRDTCFAAAGPCTPRTYLVPSTPAALAGPHAALATFSTANSPKASPLIVDKFSPAPISADGRFAAFYAPDTVAAQPASGIGDVYLTITQFQ
ncbi:MAG: IPT/TIG domain-containing protein [Candidatus Acidiferrales bacterium]